MGFSSKILFFLSAFPIMLRLPQHEAATTVPATVFRVSEAVGVPPEEDNDLGELFWAAAKRLRHASSASLERWDITPGQARALRVLSKHGDMRLNHLSEHLRIAPRSTTEVVDALEERGLVERRPDPTDRRATRVTLTAHGAEVSDEIGRARRAGADRSFAGLDPEDRRTLARILRALHD
jgi:DNA-binding MarR family transcriptional regulator